MSNVVQILERLGRSAKPLSTEECDRQMRVAGIDLEVRQALLLGDATTLTRLLGSRANVACFIIAPEEHDQPAEQQEGEVDGDGDATEGRADTRAA